MKVEIWPRRMQKCGVGVGVGVGNGCCPTTAACLLHLFLPSFQLAYCVDTAIEITDISKIYNFNCYIKNKYIITIILHN